MVTEKGSWWTYSAAKETDVSSGVGEDQK